MELTFAPLQKIAAAMFSFREAGKFGLELVKNLFLYLKTDFGMSYSDFGKPFLEVRNPFLEVRNPFSETGKRMKFVLLKNSKPTTSVGAFILFTN